MSTRCGRGAGCDGMDAKPPAPATYSSLRDRELLNQLDSRGAA
jgi:hypothetical protein